MYWFALTYLIVLAATIAFFVGASIVNDAWDRESARTLRLLALASDET